MRAMVLRGKQLTIEDVAKPAPGPGQVLARIRACGICGSDLHAARFMDQMIAAAQDNPRARWYDRDIDAGIVMGHEFCAEVVEAGPGAGQWSTGQRVTSMPVIMDPQSPSGFGAIGYSPQYPGGYGEYVLLTAAFLLPVPENVSDTAAATTEPCAVGLHAVREARIQPHESALVMGAGPIGLMTLLWLKHDRVRYVAVSDPSPERRALAQQLGADAVFDPRAVDLVTALEQALGALPPATGGAGSGYGAGAQYPAPDVVFECVGVPGTLQQALELVQVKGRVIVVGVCMEADTVTPITGINKQLTVQFVLGYTAQEYAETLAAFASGDIDTSPLVTRTIGLDELPATFSALADPKDCKVVVVP